MWFRKTAERLTCEDPDPLMPEEKAIKEMPRGAEVIARLKKLSTADRIRRPRTDRPEYAIKNPKAVETQIFGALGNHDQGFRSGYRTYLWKCKSETHDNLVNKM